MPRVVETTVGAGKNYPDWVTWNAAVNTDYAGNLTTAVVSGVTGVIAHGMGTGLLDVAANQVISGCTANRDCYKWISPDRAQGVWDLLENGTPLRGELPGAGIRPSTNGTRAWYLNEQFTLFEKMTWIGARGVSKNWDCGLMLSITGADVTARDLYLSHHNYTQGTTDGLIIAEGARSKLINCHAVYEGPADGGIMLSINGNIGGDSAAPTVINFTGVRPSDRISTNWKALKRNGATSSHKMRLRSSTFFGAGALWYTVNTTSAAFTSDSDYNATNLAAGSTDYVDTLPGANSKYQANIPGPGTWDTAGKVYVNTTVAAADWRPATGSPLDNITGAEVNSGFPNPDHSGASFTGEIPQLRNGTGNWDARGQTRSPTAPTLGALELTNANEQTGTSVAVAFALGSNSGGALRVRVGPFYDDTDTLIDGLTGLAWMIIDRPVPSADATVLAGSPDGAPNGAIDNGYFDVALSGASLDDDLYLCITNTSGAGDAAWDGWQGPVVVI